ncbi:MAG: hypothetical protein SGJ10_13900 [Bacteroidota bacterium]|nr:hypothetical protein [Bacteroidota bacterium]
MNTFVTVTYKGENINISTADYIKYRGVGFDKIKMPAVFLPYKANVDIVVSSASVGKSATLHLQSKLWGLTTAVNCCTFPIASHILDYATKNDRVLKPRLLDCYSFLKR